MNIASSRFLSSLTDPELQPPGFNPQPSTWVRLRELPSTYSFDEALLLCRAADDRWLAWIPDFGEILLEPGQFYANV
ncbi:MAG: hypothetical protein KME16_17310 [Scytolyngbya sp. HA4215-MV1]|jgi:hypothetical protein|nr:hypothetical protein [Scytolyngbya sp. HA4215-MV1]